MENSRILLTAEFIVNIPTLHCKASMKDTSAIFHS